MGERIRGFMPWGEWRPDLRYLVNSGLRVAEGVVPVYGGYISSPAISRLTAGIVSSKVELGLHVDPFSGAGYVGVRNVPATNGDIYEVTDAGSTGNVSKAVSAYISADSVSGWQGCNFGTTAIMCAAASPTSMELVQYRPSGAALFADMIASSFVPRSRFCVPFKNNLFLANCHLTAGFDGLSAGANPTLVAWSQSGVITQFGSANAAPELTGAGYQSLEFDLGEITGAAACADFAMIAMNNGFVRVEGPPYTFYVANRGAGTIFPNSLCFAGNDLYYYGPGGLTVIRNGAGSPEVVGLNRFTRSLIDNTTGFWDRAANVGAAPATDVSVCWDATNNIVLLMYAPIGNRPSAVIAYNVIEDRASYFGFANEAYTRFMKLGRQSGSTWQIGRDIRFIERDNAAGDIFYAKLAIGNSGVDSILQPGYVQPSTKFSTRFTRIRPIYHVTDQAAIEQVSITIESTNKPYADPNVLGPYTALDGGGWISTHSSTFADLHAPKFTLVANSNMHKVVEFEGFEYEVEIGPPTAY